MLVLDDAQTRAALPWPDLIDAVARMFKGDCVTPVRHHHAMSVPGESDATLLLMPAWVPGHYSGVKVLSLFPDNGSRGLPAIHGTYLLSSGKTGEILAIIDGGELTARRTAATSALASRLLSREGSTELLVCGTGRLSLNLMQAHAEVRPLTRIHVWGRNPEAAAATAEAARLMGLPALPVTDLETAARQADIISCATLSSQPLIDGGWLKAGAHLDLVGGFKPDMRETDDTAIRRSSVFVDTLAGATHEAGDIVQPLTSGVLAPGDIRAELAELLRGSKQARRSADEITLFKSVGAALEDLAGAILAYETVRGGASA